MINIMALINVMSISCACPQREAHLRNLGDLIEIILFTVQDELPFTKDLFLVFYNSFKDNIRDAKFLQLYDILKDRTNDATHLKLYDTLEDRMCNR